MPEQVITSVTGLDTSLTGAYAFGAVDLAGVVAANNFISLFNPSTSGKALYLGTLIWGKYVATTATTAASMVLYQITAASGGTDSSSSIAKLNTSYPAASAVVRTANPTVTLGAALLAQAPPLSGGSFNAAPSTPVKALGPADSLLMLPGEGVVFRTASGDVNQRWNVTFAWSEVTLPSIAK
jgi:hypothetical protein